MCRRSKLWNNKLVLNEIHRVLKQNGIFICIDSLNENPIYKLNRYLHYLRGNRTKSTLKRMPDRKLLKDYERKFGYYKNKLFRNINLDTLSLIKNNRL